MISRIKLRIRDRPRRLIFTGARGCVLLSLWCAVASAAPPPAAPPTPPPAATPAAPAAPAQPVPPDEGFLEFLGSDDVGDAAWWDFLKRAPPQGNVSPPAPPPQDAKK